jgi:4-alpha-glucanotransferase
LSNEVAELFALAGLYGIQTSYDDIAGRRVEAAPESLLAALAALKAPVEEMGEVPEALAARREELSSRLLEPVVVAWEGRPPALDLRLRPGESKLACHLDLEGGSGWRGRSMRQICRQPATAAVAWSGGSRSPSRSPSAITA